MPIDMSAAKAPPRKRTAPRTAPKPANAERPAEKTLNDIRREGLDGWGSLIQMGLLAFNLRADAAAVGMFLPAVNAEAANLADQSDDWAKPIDFIIQTSPYVAFATALIPLGLQIAANHKWVDAASVAGMGIQPPDVLDAQVRARQAQAQAQAVQEKMAAMAEAKAMQDAYERQMREAQNEMASTQTVVLSSEVAA